MVGVVADTNLLLLQEIRRWLEQYWIENEPDPDYRIALSSLLISSWPKPGKDARPTYFTLPTICGHALGKVSPSTTAANAAWVLLFIASYLLDKIEDEETKHPIFTKYSPGTVANLTTGLILHSGLIIAKLSPDDASVETLTEIQCEFHKQAIGVCVGQHQDLTIKEPTFDQVWRTVNAKSGKFFALGAYLGARLSGADETKVAVFSEVGARLGIINQIYNDLGGLGSEEETDSDLATGKHILPVQYALQVLPSEKRAKLVEYLDTATNEPSSEIEARRLIVSTGAVIYLSLEAAKHRQQAITELEKLQISSERSPLLYNLLNQFGTNLLTHE